MRRAAAPALVVALGALLLAGCGGDGHTGGSDAPSPSGGATATDATPGRGAREQLLAEVGGLVVPATDGGWVVVAPELAEEESIDRWVLASTAVEHPDAEQAIAAALEAAEADGDPSARARAGRAAALALADPAIATTAPVPEPTIAALTSRASTELRDGEGGWLGALLNLALVPGSSGDPARGELEALAGPPRCDVLPAPDRSLPGPDGPLTVPLRSLAASGARCPEAAKVLDRALTDPGWSVPIAAAPLADLLRLAPEARADHGAAVAARVARWLEPGDAEVVDLSVAVLLRRLAAAADVPFVLPDDVAFRLERIARQRGALPDRSTSPTTAFDVAILRQLAGAGVVDAALAGAAGSAVDRQAAPLTDEVVGLLVDGQAPSCTHPPDAVDAGRRSIGVVLGSAVHDVRQRHCDGGLTWPDIEAVIADGPSSEAPLRAWGAVLAACRLDPAALPEAASLELELEGPFAADPVWLTGAALAVAPHASCDAERAR